MEVLKKNSCSLCKWLVTSLKNILVTSPTVFCVYVVVVVVVVVIAVVVVLSFSTPKTQLGFTHLDSQKQKCVIPLVHNGIESTDHRHQLCPFVELFVWVNKKVKFAEVQCKTWASAVELNIIAHWMKHFQSCEGWFSPGTEPQSKYLHARLTDKSKMAVSEMRTCSLTWALTSPSPQDSWDRWSWELEKQWLETNGWLNE